MHAFAQYTVLALTAATSLVQAGSSAHGPRRLEQGQQHAKRENHLQKRFTGKFSYYDAQTGNQGACGGFIQNTEWTVALNSAQWDGGSHCGQQVTINYNGNVQVATIRDMCPGCGYGGLDLTPSLFAAFASHDVGLIYPTWNFGGNSNPAPPPPPPPPSTTWRPEPTTSQWTPEWTPPAPSTSSTRWSSTPEYTWTPPSSSRTPSSTWTPPSSSERPHSSSSSSHSSWSSSSTPSSSSSSSSLVFSPSAVANATLTGSNATSTETNSTVAAPALTTVTLGNGTVATSTLSPGAAGAANTGSPLHNSPSGTGSLANFNQVVLQLANLVVQAAEE